MDHSARTSHDPVPFLSPSLCNGYSPAGESTPAYEVKFLLDGCRAAEAEARLGAFLATDPHGDPALGGAYAVTSLYCDTPEWSAYFREGLHVSRKYRIRRYGQSHTVYLERKTVQSRRVRKRRQAVQLSDLALIPEESMGWKGAWYARQIAKNELSPVCRVRYTRRALFGRCTDGPMRVTFDRGVSGLPLRNWGFEGHGPERHLFTDAVICEFKFSGTMPTPLKRIAADLRLEAQGASKYRACIDAFAAELGIACRGCAPHA